MKYPVWLRVLAILCAAACAVATSAIPVEREGFEPTRRLIEHEGIAVFWIESSPVRASGGGDPEMADHVDVDFAVKNERAAPVEFSTASARLTTQGETFPNSLPTEIELKPGETRTIQVRYAVDFAKRPELLQRGAKTRMVLGQAGGEEIAVDVALHP